MNDVNPFNALTHSYQNLLLNYKYIKEDDENKMHVYLSKIRLLNDNILKMVNTIYNLNLSITKKEMLFLSDEEQYQLSTLNSTDTDYQKFLNLLWNMP